MIWQHEPAQWQQDDNSITVMTPASTDYWRGTPPHLLAHNAPFYAREGTGGFTPAVRGARK